MEENTPPRTSMIYTRKQELREYIVPYNPQQNRVAKRKNRTVIEAAKAMIHDHSLPMFLWEEAFSTVVYV